VSGRDGRLSLPSDWFEKRVKDEALQRKLEAIRFDNVYSVLGCFLGSGEELAIFAGPGPLNTDDLPLVTYLAPKVVYGELSPPSERLMEIVGAFHPKPADVLDPAQSPEDERTAARLASYWAARNEFLRVGMKVPETNDVNRLLASAREDLLNVIRMSPDFAAAYNPLLGMAVRLYDTDRESSHRLLLDLVDVNPGRDDARRMLARLFQE
jgi:spermidine synthase